MAVSELYPMTTRLPKDLPWLTVAKYFERVDSTQSRVTQFLPKEGEGAVVVVAESQTKGVGREGRPWVSPPGGIWMTLALPLKGMELSKVGSFSVVSALQVARALREVNALECRVKWPNDVLHEGKKIAGILFTTITKYKKPWVLIGVGINVNNPLPPELSKIATSITQIRKQSQGRSRLIEAVLSSLYTAWADFDRTGFGPYQKAVADLLVGVGDPAEIRMGTTTVKGTLRSVDPEGNLLLESATGTKTVHAGEIVGHPA